MRIAVLACIFMAAVAPKARAANVEFIRVWPEWREAGSFMSISEYFTGHEVTGGWTVVRTHKESRAGYYFLARVKNPGAAADGATFVLQVITPTSADPKTFRFPADIPKGSNVFELGLTGADWPGSTTHPVAWKLELHGADGRMLAEKASFLWEKPAGAG